MSLGKNVLRKKISGRANFARGGYFVIGPKACESEGANRKGCADPESVSLLKIR